MTNDKELITKITREYCAEQKIPTVLLAVEVCTEVIARYLAERGKEAVGWFVNVNADFDPDNPHFQQVAKQYEGDTDTYQLFLAPQPAIPEGMALVSTEIIDRFPEINPSNYDHDGVCALNAWGVELVLSVDAAAGVKP